MGCAAHSVASNVGSNTVLLCAERDIFDCDLQRLSSIWAFWQPWRCLLRLSTSAAIVGECSSVLLRGRLWWVMGWKLFSSRRTSHGWFTQASAFPTVLGNPAGPCRWKFCILKSKNAARQFTLGSLRAGVGGMLKAEEACRSWTCYLWNFSQHRLAGICVHLGARHFEP